MAGFWARVWDNINGDPVPSGSGRALTGPAASGDVDYRWYEPNVTHLGADEWAETVLEYANGVRGMNPAQLWRSQPHLRTVVSFVARNIAHLGVHVYDLVGEEDRKRNRQNDFSRALANPGDGMTQFGMIYSLVGDKMLYDRAYWFKWTDKDGSPRLRRLPPSWVSAGKRTAFGTQTFMLSAGGASKEIPRERLIVFSGYSPTQIDGCSPAVDALKETLAEQIESTMYRKQIWKRGGRTSAVIKRPLEAPPWDKDSADRFREDWYSNYTGEGPRAGGTPVLEDGMTIERLDFSALDMQWAEGAKLSLVTVCGVYHVNPTMIGVLDNANFSNVREFRKMLYGDTLGPYIREYEDVLNAFALPQFGIDNAKSYCEFNIKEKLQGSFEEEAAVLSTATGAPHMTRAEARARQNLPFLEGTDELVVPLNVLIGGMASPRDTGTQNEDPTGEDPDQVRSRRAGYKARATVTEQEQAERVVKSFFKRQEKVLRTRLGVKAAGAEDWWDQDRWDRELADDLYRLSVLVTKSVAASTLDSIGFSPNEFDVDQTLEWLKEAMQRSASSLNAATKQQIVDALKANDVQAELDSVFSSQEARATMVAVSTLTLVAGFAAIQAAKQAVGEDRATKTWLTGANPRPAHQKMDGETVLLSENFSNGAAWPGDGTALGPEDLSNCNCELQINVAGGES